MFYDENSWEYIITKTERSLLNEIVRQNYTKQYERVSINLPLYLFYNEV